MKFLKNLWHQFTQAIDEFIADLIGEDAPAQAEVVSQQADGFKAHSAGYIDPGANDLW